MALGLRGQIRQLKALLDESHRYTDVAVCFDVHERGADGRARPTGQSTPVYGGRWDAWAGEYIAPATDVLHLPCSSSQYSLLVEPKPRIEGNGGRGSGKSEGGAAWALSRIASLPGEAGQIAGPTYRILRIDWAKLLSLIPAHWLLPGKMGIRRSDRELYFVNGAVVRFCSTDNPDALRSWGGSWCWVDEEQDVTDEALDVIWPSLRLSSTPQLLSVGTPKPGEYYQRHQRLLADTEDAIHIRFDSFTNPFINPRVFDLARKQMDDRTYRQEILAEWVPVEEQQRIVLFDRARHAIKWPPQRGLDITREVTKRKTGTARDYIAGVDYNWDWPNYAILFKVVADSPIGWKDDISEIERKRIVLTALQDHSLQHWCAVAVVSSQGHAGHLGRALKNSGFYADGVLVIDDASGQYNRGGINSKNSSSRLLREEGFIVVHPSRNPSIRDAVNALNAKLSPAEGEATLHVALPECEELAVAAELGIWDKSGSKFDKTQGHDHYIDAWKYPISYFCPAAKFGPSVRALRIS